MRSREGECRKGTAFRLSEFPPNSRYLTQVPDADHSKFAIGFDRRDLPRLHELWDEIVASGRWSEGEVTARFEDAWSQWNGVGSVATGSWSGAALAALEFADIEGEAVLCPSNTFMATPRAIEHAGGRPVFVDCNRDDLCVSFEDFERKAREHKPKAAVVVHVGGHIAFEIDKIAECCRAEGIFLLEDCAHAHGADWNGRKPGSWGDAGAYSFYATKTISTGEGGMLVSERENLLEYARAFRNYGKPDYSVSGLNFRISEFTAAIGLVQTERLDEIVERKGEIAREILDPAHPARVKFPEGMTSGYYKYIVFEQVVKSTGKVYDEPCHKILGTGDELPNTDWVAANHWCVPLYYDAREAVAVGAVEAS
jgi:perosamine synthetase